MAARYILGAAGVAVGVGSLAIAHAHPATSFAGGSWGGDLALLAGGWGLLAGALIMGASRQRRTRVVAVLLAAGSFAWFVGEWDSPEVASPLVFTVGLVLFAACPPLVTWAVLAYPGGRLARWDARLTVSAGLAAAVLLGLLPALFFDPRAQGCTQCAENLILVADDPRLADTLARFGLRVGLASSLAAVVVAGWGLARSSPARRLVVAPVAAAGCIYLGLVAWTYVLGLERGFIGTGEPERRLWLGQAAALAGLTVAVGAGRLRARRTRASLAGIVVALAESARPGGLREALARTLGDAGLVVAYPVGGGRYADADGTEIELPPGREVTPLVRDGRTAAVLVHRRGLLDDASLVDEVASAARLALENERLQAELRTQEADLRASRVRIVDAGDRERRRLERDLHDGAQQRLVGLLLGLRLARAQLPPEPDEQVRERLDQAGAELQGAVDDLRVLARGIHPAVLSDEGLAAALESLAENAPRPLLLAGLPDSRLEPAVESAAYRVAAEAVAAGATRLAAVRRDGRLVVDIDTPREPDRLVELEDRVGALDGRIQLDRASAGGVRLHAEIPCG